MNLDDFKRRNAVFVVFDLVPDLKRHLEWAEDRRSELYDDKTGKPFVLPTGGKVTGGVGWNFTDRGIPEPIIDALLDYAIEETLLECGRLPYWHLLDPVRQLCVSDLVFNLGMSKWRGFVRANAALANGDYARAADELVDSAWYRQTGRRARKIANAMRTGLWVRE